MVRLALLVRLAKLKLTHGPRDFPVQGAVVSSGKLARRRGNFREDTSPMDFSLWGIHLHSYSSTVTITGQRRVPAIPSQAWGLARFRSALWPANPSLMTSPCYQPNGSLWLNSARIHCARSPRMYVSEVYVSE